MERVTENTARRVAALASQDPAAFAFLDMQSGVAADPEIASFAMSLAIDHALAGRRDARGRATRHLSTAGDVTIDEDAFRLLATADVDPLVAIAVTLAAASARTPEDRVVTLKPAGVATMPLSLETISHGRREIDLEWTLSPGVRWRTWQRTVHFDEGLTMPETLRTGAVGGPLSAIVSHPGLDGLALVAEEIAADHVHVGEVRRRIRLSDLAAFHRHLEADGLTTAPFRPSTHRRAAVAAFATMRAADAAARARRLAAVAERLADTGDDPS